VIRARCVRFAGTFYRSEPACFITSKEGLPWTVVVSDAFRVFQTTCPVCAERLGTSRGVLFQGEQLVHATCWRVPDADRPTSPVVPAPSQPRRSVPRRP
jgi:hypothetical protein